MTLIERLRGWLVADYIEAYTTGSTLIREAADEIERLTAERDALRAALDKIAERTSSDDPCRPLVQIARDTLAAIDEARKA